MIPRRIIYCWFGKGEKPQEVLDCIKSWKNKMPDWEYLEINEDNFDVFYNGYTKKAYLNKKWAFVSDVARLWALYKYGGIYMDTDVIVYKPLDKFLSHHFFSGFEQPNYPITATMGAVQGSPLIKEMLDQYIDRRLVLYEKWEDYETNTKIMSNVLEKYFDRTKTEYQENNNMAIYPQEVFTNRLKTTKEESYTEHLMLGSWTKE